jgi:uncharacterized DUF497 family protein
MGSERLAEAARGVAGGLPSRDFLLPLAHRGILGASMRNDRFSWDDAKDRINERKHGISFDETWSVFDDPLAFTMVDADHSEGEPRYITIGQSSARQLLVVASSVDGARIRIISARLATRGERKKYMDEEIDRLRDQDDDMRPEYDFSGGVRGMFYRGREVVWVRLDEELAKYFPTPESVTEALRSVMEQRDAAKR